MARVHSIFAALSLAALLGGATVQSAHASASISPLPLAYTINAGGTVTITGSTTTSGVYTGPVVVSGLPAGWSFVGSALPSSNLATITAPSNATPGLVTVTLSFTSTGGDPSALVDLNVTNVPEPSAVAFGVIAAGSVLGLVARRRKAA